MANVFPTSYYPAAKPRQAQAARSSVSPSSHLKQISSQMAKGGSSFKMPPCAACSSGKKNCC